MCYDKYVITNNTILRSIISNNKCYKKYCTKNYYNLLVFAMKTTYLWFYIIWSVTYTMIKI